MLLTRPPGYLLAVDPDELDAWRFERHLQEGRRPARRRPDGGVADDRRGAGALDAAVPTRTFAYESFAQAEIARLEELRTRGGRGPHRGRPPPRPRRRAGRRARGAGPPAPAARAVHRPADDWRCTGRAAAPTPCAPTGPCGCGCGDETRPRPVSRAASASSSRSSPATPPSCRPGTGGRSADRAGRAGLRAPGAARRERVRRGLPGLPARRRPRGRRSRSSAPSSPTTRSSSAASRPRPRSWRSLEHPHIVPLYDYWREPDAAYRVTRLFRGGTVDDAVRRGPLDAAGTRPARARRRPRRWRWRTATGSSTATCGRRPSSSTTTAAPT